LVAAGDLHRSGHVLPFSSKNLATSTKGTKPKFCAFCAFCGNC
jgi:hypothetical protein